MKITVQFPTYGRKEKFLTVLPKYVLLTSGKHEVFFNINCDQSDLSMTNTSTQETIKQILASGKNDMTYGKINFDSNTEKISAINDHATDRLFDIIICASDDMVPQVDGWDEVIVEEMEKRFPDFDGALHFSDGRRDDLITFSILGRRLYERLGYIYHPDYKSLYCDDEFTQVVKDMDKYAFIPQVLFSHEHWSIEGSENHNQIDFAVQKTLHFSGRDKSVFERRKTLGFPKERITND